MKSWLSLLHPLVAHSPDLQRLHDEGYDIDIAHAHLLVRSVPYVNSDRKVKRGTLVSELTIAGDRTGKPSTHVAMFIGDHPCHVDGSYLSAITHSSNPVTIGDGVVANHTFSAKPKSGDPADYYEKMMVYIELILTEVLAVDPAATAKVGQNAPSMVEESVFNYLETASGRAKITAQTLKLKSAGKVAIVGIGGTGSYLLDFLAKTPVPEIHLIDGDQFFNHNAFRAPGAPEKEVLDQGRTKIAHFHGIYSAMHKGIIPHDTYINAENVEALLGGMDFVFLCMDGGKPKNIVIDYLERAGKLYIDVGMGILTNGEALLGQLRVTTSTPQKREFFPREIPLDTTTDVEKDADLYSKNIQIAELNALNAALAIIKWKKLLGFYLDLNREHETLYGIDGNTIANTDKLP